MADIHPTAIVDPSATLEEGVSVGPYSIIDGDVSIGRGTRVGSHVVIRSHTEIGSENRIFQFSSLGEDPQHQEYSGEPTRLKIGDRNTIREYCTINRGTIRGLGVTQIGNDNFIMAYAHIAHDCVLGNNIIFANGASLAGHVDVEDHAILGGFTLVHQFCRIGCHCITGIGCVCLQDIPPYIVAAGNPARPYGINTKGLRRRKFSEGSIKLLTASYRIVYRRGLDLKSALAELDKINNGDPNVTVFSRFLCNSRRGTIR